MRRRPTYTCCSGRGGGVPELARDLTICGRQEQFTLVFVLANERAPALRVKALARSLPKSARVSSVLRTLGCPEAWPDLRLPRTMGPSFVGRARLKAQQVPHLVARSGVVCVSGGETRGPPGRYKRSEANRWSRSLPVPTPACCCAGHPGDGTQRGAGRGRRLPCRRRARYGRRRRLVG
jgi:hypothetical protein